MKRAGFFTQLECLEQIEPEDTPEHGASPSTTQKRPRSSPFQSTLDQCRSTQLLVEKLENQVLLISKDIADMRQDFLSLVLSVKCQSDVMLKRQEEMLDVISSIVPKMETTQSLVSDLSQEISLGKQEMISLKNSLLLPNQVAQPLTSLQMTTLDAGTGVDTPFEETTWDWEELYNDPIFTPNWYTETRE